MISAVIEVYISYCLPMSRIRPHTSIQTEINDKGNTYFAGQLYCQLVSVDTHRFM